MGLSGAAIASIVLGVVVIVMMGVYFFSLPFQKNKHSAYARAYAHPARLFQPATST